MNDVETDVNVKEIHRDLAHDLAMANSEQGGGAATTVVVSPKPTVKLSTAVVRIAVNSKNRLAIRALSKDLSEAGCETVQRVYETKNEEVAAYKEAIEQIVQEHCTPEQIDWLNKVAGSPFAILVEIELEKFVRLKRELAILAKQSKSASANESVKEAA